MPDTAPYLRPENQGVSGVPYNVPKEVRRYGAAPNAMGLDDAVPYISDTPWKPDLNTIPNCVATKVNGEACRAKPLAGEQVCHAHLPK
jgi:hypothetical protein